MVPVRLLPMEPCAEPSLMPKPDPHSDAPPEDNSVPQGDPSFEKLMRLVFSRPIYLEPPDEPEEETGGEVEEGREETGREAQPQ